MTSRGYGFPDNIEKNYLTNMNKKRKICHVSCTFYISGFIYNEPCCKFCQKGFNEK